jgi:hypothetical protein
MRKHVDRSKLCQLRALADALGYTVVFRRVKAMRECEDGLWCPDLYKIYVDPNSEDVLYTVAHEIGHVLADYLIFSDEPEEYSERVANIFADTLIGLLNSQPTALVRGLTRTFGHKRRLK